jgi:hypothetical protein
MAYEAYDLSGFTDLTLSEKQCGRPSKAGDKRWTLRHGVIKSGLERISNE